VKNLHAVKAVQNSFHITISYRENYHICEHSDC